MDYINKIPPTARCRGKCRSMGKYTVCKLTSALHPLYTTGYTYSHPSDLPLIAMLVRGAHGYNAGLHVSKLVSLYRELYKLASESGLQASDFVPGINARHKRLEENTVNLSSSRFQ